MRDGSSFWKVADAADCTDVGKTHPAGPAANLLPIEL
jgi:hypothetical protein